ncbi:MAG: hypothetical protein Q9217_001893 [Psora testacea]
MVERLLRSNTSGLSEVAADVKMFPQDPTAPATTITNACASVALLNIVNNIPEIELGEHLKAFKEFTMDFSPALRGDAISNFDFLKEIHNSFARKTDMLNADLALRNEVATKSKNKKPKAVDDDSDAGFHFIAFVTIDDKLWKLDGLERQPMCLGPIQGDWVSQAKPDIEARMAQYDGEQIEFAILSLIKDPLLKLLPALATSIKSIAALSSRLNEVKPNWRESTVPSGHGEDTYTFDTVMATDASYGLEQQHIDTTTLSDPTLMALLSSQNASGIMAFRQKLITEQVALRIDIREEHQSAENDERRAQARSRDFGARMQNFARKVKAKQRSTQPAYPQAQKLQFRMRLFKFVALFTRRKNPSQPPIPPRDPQELRKGCKGQANAFRSNKEEKSSANPIDLAQYLAHSEEVMHIRQEMASGNHTHADALSRRTNHLPSVSLLDTLPCFMALSAAQIALQGQSSITDVWMRLTAGFMAQAVAEQYLVYKSQRSEVLQEAFAWGFDEGNTAEEGSDSYLINVMFWDEEAERANSTWEEIRNEHIRALIPQEGTSLQDHLRNLLASKLSIPGFEERMHAFLEGLHRGQEKPLLAQVESGRLEGQSEREVQAFRERVGLL